MQQTHILSTIEFDVSEQVDETEKKIESPADNERFHASGGVRPQKHLCEFASVSPARTFVNPRLREAADTLWAIYCVCHG